MSLAQELTSVLSALDLLVIIQMLTCTCSKGRVIIHLMLQGHFAILGIQFIKTRCKEWVTQGIDETCSWTLFAI